MRKVGSGDGDGNTNSCDSGNGTEEDEDDVFLIYTYEILSNLSTSIGGPFDQSL